eukprot:m.55146 g.55146  ORF g.55146 m.55146 type:complete len:57 (+) comp7582_c0_seq2:1335-1505(+)
MQRGCCTYNSTMAYTKFVVMYPCTCEHTYNELRTCARAETQMVFESSRMRQRGKRR